ncbi:hypothetical protein GCM10008023_41420 [Sphingomonas glacialis]|uniref:Uncharacterized protein n=1 Tax=Sphingomonas glacialis TaxID=658225 RepID=A0ABQ3LUV5_9SPHN|nr:hypothetical protein GCM10008023_41420 [Sphingomonas glacialis]
MLIRAAILAGLLAAQPSRLDFKLMTSLAYRSFADKADALCPARGLRRLHPADLGGIEEDFMPSMTRREHRRNATLNRGDKGCTDAGVSCPAQNTLAAISHAGLLDAFVGFACASAIWRSKYLSGWATIYRPVPRTR